MKDGMIKFIYVSYVAVLACLYYFDVFLMFRLENVILLIY